MASSTSSTSASTTPNSFDESAFRAHVGDALSSMRRVLDHTRASSLAAADTVPHAYDDKYALAVACTRAALAALRTALLQRANAGAHEATESALVQRWADGGGAVTLRFDSVEECVFVKKVVREVRSDTTRVYESTVFGTDKSYTLTTVTEYLWDVAVRHRVVVFTGAAPSNDSATTVVLRSHDAGIRLCTNSDKTPRAARHEQPPLDVDIGFLLRAHSSAFDIDRSVPSCRTPRRNADVERALECTRALVAWCDDVSSYFASRIFPIHADHELDLAAATGATAYRSVLVPVLALLEQSGAVDHESLRAAALKEYERTLDDKLSALRVAFPPVTAECTSFAAVDKSSAKEKEKAAKEAASARKERDKARARGEQVEDERDQPRSPLISAVDVALVALARVARNVCHAYAQAVDFLEWMLQQQLVAAIGKRVTPAMLADYVRFHNRKLYAERYQPVPFAYAIRRPDHSPEGELSIEAWSSDGSLAEPLYTTMCARVSVPAQGTLVLAEANDDDDDDDDDDDSDSDGDSDAGGGGLRSASSASSGGGGNAKRSKKEPVQSLAASVLRQSLSAAAMKGGRANLRESLGLPARAGADELRRSIADQGMRVSAAFRTGPPPITFALDAATTVRFFGRQHLHGCVRHQFAEGDGAGATYQLTARARQFSSFIIVVGRMMGPDQFAPKHAMILQNKDEVLIPLLLNTIPSPKEFKDAIASLSPEQQRFAKAFRGMQLESTLFAVAVLQIKPQLEFILNLPSDSLTKEIELTQQLLELFIDYQLPTDMLAFDGAASETTANKVAAVRASAAAMQAVIAREKQKQMEDEVKKSLYRNTTNTTRTPKPPPPPIDDDSDSDSESDDDNFVPIAKPPSGSFRAPEKRSFGTFFKSIRGKLFAGGKKKSPSSPVYSSGQDLAMPSSALRCDNSLAYEADLNFGAELQCASLECAALEMPVQAAAPPPMRSVAAAAPPPAPTPASLSPSTAPSPSSTPSQPTEGASDKSATANGDATDTADQHNNDGGDGGDGGDDDDVAKARAAGVNSLFVVDYTKVPTSLEQRFGALDSEGAVRPTILALGDEWTLKRKRTLLSDVAIEHLDATAQRRERQRAFDLLDALTRSGALPMVGGCEFHVVIVSTHCFGKTLMDTLVMDNVNPIEKLERSSVIMASTVHATPAERLLKDDEQRERVDKYSPGLLSSTTPATATTAQ